MSMADAIHQLQFFGGEPRPRDLLAAVFADDGGAMPIIRRVWAMPNRWTFRIPPIRQLILRHAGPTAQGWANPFAGQSTFGDFRNDLDPSTDQPNHMEAVEFLRRLTRVDGVLFDPPYSVTQVHRAYKDIGRQFAGTENPTGGFPKCRDEIARIVRFGGKCISCGWNSAGMGRKRGFEIIEILLVAHGGTRNDTIVTVEQKL